MIGKNTYAGFFFSLFIIFFSEIQWNVYFIDKIPDINDLNISSGVIIKSNKQSEGLKLKTNDGSILLFRCGFLNDKGCLPDNGLHNHRYGWNIYDVHASIKWYEYPHIGKVIYELSNESEIAIHTQLSQDQYRGYIKLYRDDINPEKIKLMLFSLLISIIIKLNKNKNSMCS